VTGDCRRLRNKGLHDLYCLTKIIRVIKSRRMRWADHVARMGERRSSYRVLVGKLEGKKPFGKPRRRLEIIIKTVNQKWDGDMEWVYLAQDRKSGGTL